MGTLITGAWNSKKRERELGEKRAGTGRKEEGTWRKGCENSGKRGWELEERGVETGRKEWELEERGRKLGEKW